MKEFGYVEAPNHRFQNDFGPIYPHSHYGSSRCYGIHCDVIEFTGIVRSLLTYMQTMAGTSALYQPGMRFLHGMSASIHVLLRLIFLIILHYRWNVIISTSNWTPWSLYNFKPSTTILHITSGGPRVYPYETLRFTILGGAVQAYIYMNHGIYELNLRINPLILMRYRYKSVQTEPLWQPTFLHIGGQNPSKGPISIGDAIEWVYLSSIRQFLRKRNFDLAKVPLNCLNHIHIGQVSLQLSCTDTHQI